MNIRHRPNDECFRSGSDPLLGMVTLMACLKRNAEFRVTRIYWYTCSTYSATWQQHVNELKMLTGQFSACASEPHHLATYGSILNQDKWHHHFLGLSLRSPS